MQPLTPLCELAKKYQTDKGGRHFMYNGQPSEHCHEYTPLYYDIFKDKTEKVRRVLEIGVNSGASLRMWEEFFPNAEIIGLDIDFNYLFNAGRIKCLYANAGDSESLRGAVLDAGSMPLYDLIVDDGSHDLSDQVCSLQTLLPMLAPDGVYIVEDCYHPHNILAAVPDGFAAVAAETDNNKGGVDCLVFITHG